jgi:hypothetical protein
MRLDFTSDMDPKRFAVNIRFLSNRALPPDVRAAKEELSDETSRQMVTQNPGWRQRPSDFYIVAIDFYMADFKTDIDGPVKRSLDAVCHGAGIFDSRVLELYVRKYRSWVPGIGVSISQCRRDDYDLRSPRKGKTDVVDEESF